MWTEEAFLFYEVCVDDQSSSPNYTAKSHVCVCTLIEMRVLSSGSFPSASLTFCNFCVSCLFIEWFDNARGRVESLFL